MLKLNTYNQSINCVCVSVSLCVYSLYILVFFVSLLLFWLLAVCSEFFDILVEYNLKRFPFCFVFFYNLNFCFVNSDRLLKFVLFIYLKCVNFCFKEVIIRVCCVYVLVSWKINTDSR